MSQTTTPDDEPPIDHPLADNVDTFAVDDDHNGFWELVANALSEAEDQLESNRMHVSGATRTVDEVLSPDNVYDVEVRNPDYQNPKVTVWLSDAPHWANWAGNRTLVRTDGRKNLDYVLDVRPF